MKDFIVDNAKSIILIQSWIRGYMARKEAKQMAQEKEKNYKRMTKHFSKTEIYETLLKSNIE
jgi:GT2 family glycosyltransferase